MPKPPTIALVGMRCAGKSVIGRALASQMDLAYLDLDLEVLVEARHSGFPAASAGELLERAGQCAFRGFEAAALRRILEPNQHVVLATGGGTLERASNRGWLKRCARVVWLRASASVLRERMQADDTWRPSLTGKDPAAEVEELLARRSAAYGELSELKVDSESSSPLELARGIARDLMPNPSRDGPPQLARGFES